MIGISTGLTTLLLTLPLPAQERSLVTIRPGVQAELTPAADFAMGVARIDGRETRNRTSSRDKKVAGIALIVSGTGMMVLNSVGLASGTTIPPGGARDGYLGKPGVVIGAGLVITGGVVLYRAFRKP